MDQQKSPSPAEVPHPEPAKLPTCARCGAEVENIKYLDYGDIRVVFHAEMGCTLGVMKAE